RPRRSESAPTDPLPWARATARRRRRRRGRTASGSARRAGRRASGARRRETSQPSPVVRAYNRQQLKGCGIVSSGASVLSPKFGDYFGEQSASLARRADAPVFPRRRARRDVARVLARAPQAVRRSGGSARTPAVLHEYRRPRAPARRRWIEPAVG